MLTLYEELMKDMKVYESLILLLSSTSIFHFRDIEVYVQLTFCHILCFQFQI